jgi:hypothetical protein
MMAQAQKLVDLSGLGEALGEDVTSAIEQASDKLDISKAKQRWYEVI